MDLGSKDSARVALRSLRVHSGFAIPALLLMVVVFTAFGSSSAVIGAGEASGSAFVPRLTPDPIATPLEAIQWTQRLRSAQLAQEAAAQEMMALTIILLVLVAVVALIGLVGLWTEETSARSEEVAIRRAVGASRATVLRERFFETLILVLLAWGLGSCLASVARTLAGSTWPGVVREAAPVLFAGILLGTALVCLLRGSTLSLQATAGGVLAARLSLAQPKEDIPGRGVLVVFQLALIVCLMAGTVMLWRGPLSLRGNPGSSGLGSSAAQGTDLQRYEFTGGGAVSLALALDEIEAMPGVQSAGYASPGALIGLGRSHHVMTDCGRCFVGSLYVPLRGTSIVHHFVTADTFRYAGIPLIEGRLLQSSDHDEHSPVAVVSESFAREHFENGDAVGRRLRVGNVLAGSAGGPDEGWYTVVGVVEDAVRWAIGAGDQPLGEVYLSPFQHPVRQGDLLVEWGSKPRDQDNAAVEAIAASASIQIESGEPVAAYIDRSTAQIGWFGGVWSVLAIVALMVGIFGVYSTVRMRTEAEVREIGIRRAVGATRRRIVADYVVEVLRLSVPGIALGLWLSLYVRALLPAIPPFDIGAALTLVGLVIIPILGAVSLGAIRPAWLAAKAKPAEVLGR